jgi:O-methyltransferase involved in polyketide biosynthesis
MNKARNCVHQPKSGGTTVTGDPAGADEVAGACGFDPRKPNAARVYDYLLGGKDHFAADRHAAERLVSALPDAAMTARANRAFLTTAVRHVAHCGIRQYVDIGAGLPTSPNVHESARAVVPGARVAYVDNDPVALAHARALLATDDFVIVVDGDARNYEAILAAPELGTLIDLSEPVCVLLVSMLHFMTADEADTIVAALRERMAPGSYLVISAGHQENYRVREQVQAAYGDTTVLTGRPAAEITAYFDGFDLVPPGVVPVTEWPLDDPDAGRRPLIRQVSPAPVEASMLAGIGRKRG